MKKEANKLPHYYHCSGYPFLKRTANIIFEESIREVYRDYDYSVNEIVDDATSLVELTKDVIAGIERHEIPSANFCSDDLRHWKKLKAQLSEPTDSGYSLIQFVAKRLVLLRKAGKLVRKKPIFDKPRTGKRKKERQGANAGSLIKKVE